MCIRRTILVPALAFGFAGLITPTTDAATISSIPEQSGAVSDAANGLYIEPATDGTPTNPDIVTPVGNRNIATKYRGIYRFDMSPFTAQITDATFSINLLNESVPLENLRPGTTPHARFEILDIDRDVDIDTPNNSNGLLGPDVNGAATFLTDVEITDFRGETDPALDNQLITFDITSELEDVRLDGFTNATIRITLVDQDGDEISEIETINGQPQGAQLQFSETANIDYTLIPEPASVALMSLGLAAMATRRTRRQ